MREIRQSGSEGGEPQLNAAFLPLSLTFVSCVLLSDRSNLFFNESEIDANENSRNWELLFGARCSV